MERVSDLYFGHLLGAPGSTCFARNSCASVSHQACGRAVACGATRTSCQEGCAGPVSSYAPDCRRRWLRQTYVEAVSRRQSTASAHPRELRRSAGLPNIAGRLLCSGSRSCASADRCPLRAPKRTPAWRRRNRTWPGGRSTDGFLAPSMSQIGYVPLSANDGFLETAFLIHRGRADSCVIRLRFSMRRCNRCVASPPGGMIIARQTRGRQRLSRS